MTGWKKLRSGTVEEKKLAAARLGERPSARAAAALVQLHKEYYQIDDPNLRPNLPPHFSEEALSRMGRRAVPAVAAALEDEQENHRVWAIEWLQAEGYSGAEVLAPVVPEVIAALTDDCWYVRLQAAQILGRLECSAAIPALSERLEDPDGQVRLHSAIALVDMKAREAAVIETCIDALRSPPGAAAGSDYATFLRSIAAYVLGRIGPAAGEAADLMHPLLEAPKVDVRIRSALALWKVSGDAGRAVPVLRAALTPESAYHIRDAIRALGEIGPAARSALPDLEALSGDPDEWVRKDAREAAERIAGRIPLPDPARR